jgi:hypothetical protein
MGSSFSFVDLTLPIDESMLRVAQGFHGLFLYANDYWPEHLLTYAREIGGLNATLASDLFAELTKLYNTYEAYKQKLSASHVGDISESSENTFDERLSYLKVHEGICSMIRDLFSYRQSARNHQNTNITRK